MRVYRYVHSDTFPWKSYGTFPVEGKCLEANRLASEPDVHVCYTVVHTCMCLLCI